MNEMQSGVLMLVKSALTGKVGVLPAGFSLEQAERMIIKHQIVGLAYEGAIICGVPKSDSVMQRLFQIYYQHTIRDEKQKNALKKLYQAFEENGFDYLPVKGLDMKKLYPNPAMRPMGDADVLIRMEQYEKIRPVMMQLGYQEGEQTGHELIWDCPALHLELHRQLMSSYFPDLQNYYGDGWKYAVLLQGHRHTYAPEDMYLYHFAHLVKHYRRGGIGLRHVLDLWLFRNSNPTINWDYVEQELARLRLQEFHQNICKMVACWFSDGDTDEITEYLTDFFFNSGSWGTHDNYIRFLSMRSSKYYKCGRTERIRKIWLSIFPTRSMMENRYPVLKKSPWLLPVFWPVRWITAVLFRRNNIRSTQRDLKNSSKKEVSLYEESLHYVGLHYDG